MIDTRGLKLAGHQRERSGRVFRSGKDVLDAYTAGYKDYLLNLIRINL